jgi:DNA-binding transcriptional LysR family regulator
MTLLLVFQELMQHRKLTVVAQRLGFTQSAISHSVRRLREIFGDDLFTRRPTGVEPTARALEIEPQIRALLELAGEMLRGRSFSPAEASGVVRIAAPDYHSTLLAAPLIEKVRKAAPGLQLSFRPLVRQTALQALEASDIDLALGFFWNIGDRFLSCVLYEDDYAVVVRGGHAGIGKKLTFADYVNAHHIVVSLDGSVSGIVDRVLARDGHSRKLVAAVPFFTTALATVARSDLIATVPRRLAEAFAPPFGLRVLEPPISIRPYRVSIVWHERNDKSALHSWIIAEVEECALGKDPRGRRGATNKDKPLRLQK